MAIVNKVYAQGPVFSVVGHKHGYALTARVWVTGIVPGYVYYVLAVHDYLSCARRRCKALNTAIVS